VRVFIALRIPEIVERGLAGTARRLRSIFPGLAVPRPEGLHLTLHFFGEREASEVDMIRNALLDASLRLPAIDAALGGLGAFPPSGPMVRVVYAGFVEGVELIRATREKIGLALQKSGVTVPEENRPFTPHLTLGRCRSGTFDRKVLAGIDVPEEPFRIDRCVFYQSILKPDGACYEPLAERKLDGILA
jgi:RNA 2',3'-cyclic 3'-phosphodiesterase